MWCEVRAIETAYVPEVFLLVWAATVGFVAAVALAGRFMVWWERIYELVCERRVKMKGGILGR